MADSIKFTNKYIDCTGVWDSTLSKTQQAINAQKLDIANIVNNFTTTTTGTYALDAAAGKTLNDSLAKLAARFRDQNSGQGTLNTTYWNETVLNYVIMDNLCIVHIGGHLKIVSGYEEIIVGSNFPESMGRYFNISSVMTNEGKIIAQFSVNSSGQLSIHTREAITTTTTVTGELLYILK